LGVPPLRCRFAPTHPTLAIVQEIPTLKENESIKLYESLKQLSKTQFDEICFYLQNEYGYDLNLISLDKVPLADSAMQLIHLLAQYPDDGFNHLQNALERQIIKSGNPLIPQKKTLIIIFSLSLLILLIAIYLAKRGNTVIIDIDSNSQSPIHIEQDKEINVYGISPDRFQQLSEEQLKRVGWSELANSN